MTEATSPVFIHSLFRAGSTYIFSVFRRTGAFYCFQESLHEFAYYARHAPDLLVSAVQPSEQLRHPKLDDGYFSELAATNASWRNSIHEQSIYADAFGDANQAQTIEYFRSLVAASPRRPVFQECRTAFRITSLREAMQGIHIALLRNPWDQWWSYKAADYFDVANCLFLNAPKRPAVVDRLRNAIEFESCAETSIEAQFEFYSSRRPSAEASYLTFFTLWCIAGMEAQKSAHVELDIDSLSSDKSYRERTFATLEQLGISGLDLSDCDVPAMSFSRSDAEFFEPLEDSVFEMFDQVGLSQTKQKALRKRASLHRTIGHGSRSHDAILRQLTRKLESRVSVLALKELGSNKAASEAAIRIDELRGKLAEASLLTAQSQAVAADKAADIGQLRELLNDKAGEIGQMRDLVESKAAEIGVMLANLDEKSTRIAQLEDAHQTLTHNVAAARSEAQAWRSRADAYNLQRQADAVVIAAQAEAVVKLQQEQARLMAHIQWQDARLEEVWRSSSWRATEPFRRIRRVVHRLSAPLLLRAKQIARSGIDRGRIFIQGKPHLRRLVIAGLDFVPPVKMRLMSYAERQRGKSSQSTSSDAFIDYATKPTAPWSGTYEDDVNIALEVLRQN